MDRIVGIGEYVISNNKSDIIKTFALATCVAVTVYSALKTTAGMVHIVLPHPTSSGNDKSQNPYYYATTAVPALINEMQLRYGCKKDELDIKLFGGAKSVFGNDIFNIGNKNVEMVKKVLGEMGLRYSVADTGGVNSRTLIMEIADGTVRVLLQPIII